MDLTAKIGLGTVQFGIPYGIGNVHGITSEEEVASILAFAGENGISLLDTAPAYGKSEEVLGNNNLQNIKVVSKVMLQGSNHTISEQLDNSLGKLKIPSLYGYLAHLPMEIINEPKLWDELLKLKEAGRIEKIGFSFNEVSEVEALLLMGITPDIVQVPFNYLDNRFLPTMIELKKRSCEIHTRSTFLQGLLFCDPSRLSGFFNKIKPVITELQKNGDHLPGMLLRYCLVNPYIDYVIIGVNTLEQLIENLNCFPNAKPLNPLDIQLNEEIITPSKWPEHAFTTL
jgi:aryl-alcohol dehydrogenase-like predicted oxidoreductase